MYLAPSCSKQLNCWLNLPSVGGVDILCESIQKAIMLETNTPTVGGMLTVTVPQRECGIQMQ